MSLTPLGRRQFARMAREHEQWLTELFQGLDAGDKQALYEQLARLRLHLAQASATTPPAREAATNPPRRPRP